MKFLDVLWFSGGSTVGIVRVEVDEGTRYYIGAANCGLEGKDIEYIMAYGARFPNNIGDMLFGVEFR
jgi:hypothetical protein